MTSRNLQAETHIHDMSPFHFLARLNAHGLGSYPSRAMVCPGTTVTGYDDHQSFADLLENQNYLRRVGIGTDKIIPIQGTNVMDGLLRDDGSLGLVRRSIHESGRPLRLYLTRSMEPLVTRLGLGWDDILTPEWSLAERFDDKRKLRELGLELGAHRFVPWRFLTEKDLPHIRDIRAGIFAEADEVVPTEIVFLKRPDYDGGEGLLKWRPETPWEEVRIFLEEHLRHGVLMEAGYPESDFDMTEASVQIEIDESDWEPVYPSIQLTENNAHKGNEILLGEKLIDPATWKQMRTAMKPFAEEAARLGMGRKHKRLIGFDFLIVKSGGETHVFLSEVNARGTAPQYAYAVARQAAPRFGDRASVIMENYKVTRGRSHLSLEEQLAAMNLLWKGDSDPGVVIGNAGCIRHGKVTLFCVGKTLEDTRDLHRRLPPL